MRHADRIIRPATPADIPAIAAIYADAVAHRHRDLRARAAGRGRDGAADERRCSRAAIPISSPSGGDGAVLGYAYAGPYRTAAGLPPHRRGFGLPGAGRARQGIGSALLAALIAECEALGFRQMIAVIGDASRTPPRFGCTGGGLRAAPARSRTSATSTAAGSTGCSCSARSARGGRRPRRATPRSGDDQPEPAVEDAQHVAEVVAALQDQAGRGDDRIGALPARKSRLLDDAVERHFGGAAEDREDRLLAELVDGVVAPLAVGDLAAIDLQDLVEFPRLKRIGASVVFRLIGGGRSSCARPPKGSLSSPSLMAPPLSSSAVMIVPFAREARPRMGDSLPARRAGRPCEIP